MIFGSGGTHPVRGTFVARNTSVALDTIIKGYDYGAAWNFAVLVIGQQPSFTLSTALVNGTPTTTITLAAATAATLLRTGTVLHLGAQTAVVSAPTVLATGAPTNVPVNSFTPSTGYAIGAAVTLDSDSPMCTANTTNDFITPNPGVTNYQFKWLGALDPDTGGTIRDKPIFSGLTIGQTYVWQLYAGIESSVQKITVGSFPTYMDISPDGSTLYVCNFTSGTVHPVAIGGRPGWKLGASATILAKWNSQVGTPVTPASGAFRCKVSPDGTKLAVCGSGAAGNVTFYTITPGTNATVASLTLLGSSAILAAGKHCTALAWSSDSTMVWAACNNGSLYPVTAVASPVIGTPVVVVAGGTTVNAIVINGAVGWTQDNVNRKVIPLTAITDTTLTLGTPVTVPNEGGTINDMAMLASDGSVWVASSSYVTHISSAGAVLVQYAHRLNTNGAMGIVVSADGKAVWISGPDGTQAFEVPATPNGYSGNGLFTQPVTYGGLNMYGAAMTSDGTVFFGSEQTTVWSYPGGSFNVGTSFLPTGQGVRVIANGATLT